ncbi:hypothetical protein lerEdw1_008365 [Lerista edwardsae]|nr:hypothetical protein lerEdw1_008365 [Lerista edwardsae]
MMFLLILILLRESTGDTFFRHYEKETPTLTCSKAAAEDEIVWYAGQGSSSLLKFELMNCDENGKPLQPCGVEEKELEESDSLCTERNIFISAFPAGGIFACKPLIDNKSYRCPVFNDEDDCNTYDFFIIAIINSTDQVKSDETRKPVEPPLSPVVKMVNEKDNFTLSCEFVTKGNDPFAMYWIKDTDPNTCIFSVTNEDNGVFYHDDNCCIDATIKRRRTNNSTGSGEEHQRHDITIHNAIPSDSGRYLCVFSEWHKKQHKWKIRANVSVEVKGAMWTGNALKTSSGGSGHCPAGYGVWASGALPLKLERLGPTLTPGITMKP